MILQLNYVKYWKYIEPNSFVNGDLNLPGINWETMTSDQRGKGVFKTYESFNSWCSGWIWKPWSEEAHEYLFGYLSWFSGLISFSVYT